MWKLVTFFIVFVLCLCYVCAANPGQKLGPQIVIKRGNSQSAALLDDPNSQSPCDPDSSCVPISGCPLLFDLIDQSCFGSDKYFRRFNSLTCGHSGEEALICCPPGGYSELLRPGETRPPSIECGDTLVKGNYEGPGSQPWVARIGFSNKQTGRMRYPCSGSIVDKRVILTAAHCALAKAEGFKLISVLVGEWDTEQTSDCNEMFCAPPTQTVLVDNVVVHPGYEKKIFRHDIALIVLREDINFSLTAVPICINDSPDHMTEPRGTLVGWGKLSGQAAQMPRQQQLSVPMVPLSRCEKVFGAIVPIHEGQLCAGGEEGKDACSGFGGSPLVMKIMGRFSQVGIVSFGSENCGSPGVPSVYTNVAHYANWIRENIPSETEN